MARAAVRAKQTERAKAEAAKPRGQRKHASGGNPNQDLFFMRLRRRQKWVFLVLAVLFAVSFTLLGVGSGGGGGLQQVWNSILGSGSDPVATAQGEIKSNPTKGYTDLANAYITKHDLAGAIAAMQSYLQIKSKDGTAWLKVGEWEQQQGQTYATQYQQVLQATQLQAPGSVIQPTGKLAGAFGTNPIDQFYAQQNSTLSQPLAQQETAALNASLTAFQNAAKYEHAKDARAAAEYQAFTVAYYAGNQSAALAALQKYIQLNPSTPNAKQIEGICKRLGGSCALKHKKK